jgi:hypothetical protein
MGTTTPGFRRAPFALSDPQLEKEADAAGRRLAAAIQTGAEPSSRKRRFPLGRDTNWDFVQCYVAIKLMGMSAPRELTEANSAYDEIYEGTQKGGDASLGNPMILKKTQILQVLKQWIGTYNNRAARFVLSQPAVRRTYESWSELARALIGEVDSAPNLLKEDDLAKKDGSERLYQRSFGKPDSQSGGQSSDGTGQHRQKIGPEQLAQGRILPLVRPSTRGHIDPNDLDPESLD